jgi:transcriptional antiterminator
MHFKSANEMKDSQTKERGSQNIKLTDDAVETPESRSKIASNQDSELRDIKRES